MTSTDTMTVAIAQVQVLRAWQDNLAQVDQYAADAAAGGARLLLAPEGIIARDPSDPNFTNATAQPLDGPFVEGLREISQTRGIAIGCTVHVPRGDGHASNVFLVVDKGQIVAEYAKIHLYDAFASKESDNVTPGDDVPDLVDIDGFRFGLLTCYDVRFPELARIHAVRGADALLISAAWVRGSLKEMHWQVMVTARALENTCYAVASGEISSRNIGCSMVVDPLGVTVAAAAEQPALVFSTLERRRLIEARAALPVLANRRFADPVLSPR
ncbi:carbon-nitrogen hydrolase family protein [Mariniluteicoccus endophyticus]